MFRFRKQLLWSVEHIQKLRCVEARRVGGLGGQAKLRAERFRGPFPRHGLTPFCKTIGGSSSLAAEGIADPVCLVWQCRSDL